jgi:hypothetical protein
MAKPKVCTKVKLKIEDFGFTFGKAEEPKRSQSYVR